MKHPISSKLMGKGQGQDQLWCEVLEDQSKRLQNRLNQILKALAFEPAGRTEKLMAAIDHFQTHDGVITDQAPVDFLIADKHGALTCAAEHVNENETPLCVNQTHSITVAGNSILDRFIKIKPYG